MGWASVQSLPVHPVRYEVCVHVLHHEVHPHQVLQGAGEALEEQADSNVLPRRDFYDSRWCFRDHRTRHNEVSKNWQNHQ